MLIHVGNHYVASHVLYGCFLLFSEYFNSFENILIFCDYNEYLVLVITLAEIQIQSQMCETNMSHRSHKI